jgi:hypothetical protein
MSQSANQEEITRVNIETSNIIEPADAEVGRDEKAEAEYKKEPVSRYFTTTFAYF